MANLKIFLDKGETQADAEEMILKSLEHHSSGSAHDGESFDDPAMVDVCQKMEREHQKIYADMINEVIDALEKQYTK